MLAVLWCGLAAVAPVEARDAGWRAETVARMAKPPLNSYYSGDVAIAANARGRRVIVWAERHGLYLAVAQPGHRFGPARLVHGERHDVTRPRVAMNERGDAVVLWTFLDGTYVAGPEDRDESCCYRGRVAVLRRDGRLGPIATLSPRGVESRIGAYAIGADGRYGVAWRESDEPGEDILNDPGGKARRALLVRISRRGRLGPVKKLDRWNTALALAFVHGRPRVLAYAPNHRLLVERIGHRDGRFGASNTVFFGVPDDPEFAAAANGRGDEAVAWTDYTTNRVSVGSRVAGGPLRWRVVGTTDSFAVPTVAIAPSGAAAVAWASGAGRVRVATSAGRGARFHHASTVFSRHTTAYPHTIELAVDSHRRAVVAWYAGEYRRLSNVHAAVVEPGGRRTRHVRFRGRGHATIPASGTAAFDEHGRATVVWVRGHEIRAARVSVDR